MADEVAAWLEDLRARNEAFGEGAADVPALLAALGAALAKAAEWEETAAGLNATAERCRAVNAPAGTATFGAAAEGYGDCARELREAISRALLGEVPTGG